MKLSRIAFKMSTQDPFGLCPYVLVVVGTLASVLISPKAQAGSANWKNTGASADFSDGTNWSTGIAPGNNTNTNNTDAATFDTALTTFGTTANPIIIDANRNFRTLSFATNVGSFTLGTTSGNALHLFADLNNLRGIYLNAGTASVTETINAPIVLEPISGSTALSQFTNLSASGLLLIGGAVSLGTSANGTLQLNGSNTGQNTVSGIIGNGTAGGVLSLAKNDAGTWVLSGTNTYSGGTTLTGGTLSMGNNSALGSGTVTFNGGTLATNGRSFSNAMVANASTTSVVSAGNVASTISGALTGSGRVNFVYSAAGSVTIPDISSNLSGFTGTIEVDSATNLYARLSGGTTGTAGAGSNWVIGGSGGFVYTSAATVSFGSLSGTGSLAAANGNTTYSIGALDSSTTFSGSIINNSFGGVTSITKVGSGILTLTGGGSNFTGNILVSNGTLKAATTNVNSNNPTAGILGNTTVARSITVSSGATLEFAIGNVLSTGNYNPANVTLNLNGGTLRSTIGDTNALGIVNLNGGTITATTGTGNTSFQSYVLNETVTTTGTAQSVISTTGSGNNGYHLGVGTNKTITFNVDPNSTGASLLISAPLIGGSGTAGGAAGSGIIKSGGGVMTLSGTNTYSGATSIDAGTLVVNGNQTAAAGAVSVSGILAGSGGIVGGNTTINSSGHLAVGNGTAGSIGTETFNGTINFASSSIFDWDLNGTNGTDPGALPNQGTYDQVITNAAASGAGIFKVILGAGSFADAFWNTNKTWTNVFSGIGTPASLASIFSSFSGTNVGTDGTVPGEGQFSFTPTGNTLAWSAVPEPTSALAGLLLGAGLLRRRRAA